MTLTVTPGCTTIWSEVSWGSQPESYAIPNPDPNPAPNPYNPCRRAVGIELNEDRHRLACSGASIYQVNPGPNIGPVPGPDPLSIALTLTLTTPLHLTLGLNVLTTLTLPYYARIWRPMSQEW